MGKVIEFRSVSYTSDQIDEDTIAALREAKEIALVWQDQGGTYYCEFFGDGDPVRELGLAQMLLHEAQLRADESAG